MLKIQIVSLVVACLLATVGVGSARDILVPVDAATLGDALDQAASGDRILLSPGHYDGADLDLVDGITILGSPDDPESVVVAGATLGRVFRAESIQSVSLIGLTISSGDAKGGTSYDTSGGGLFVSNAMVTLRHVRFVGNEADYSGGALRISHGQVDAEDCVFSGNRAIKGGGALDLSYDSVAELTRCVFRDNTAAWGGAISARASSSCWLYDSVLSGNTTIAPQELGGAFFADFASSVVFTRCVLAANAARQGGAVRMTGAHTGFVNCTVDSNEAWESGAAFMVIGGSLYIDHSIVSFNQGEALASDDCWLSVMSSDVFGNLGGNWVGDLAPMRYADNNLEADPLFCDLNPYFLQDESPCAEANSPVGLIGAQPAGCEDVGVVLQNFTAVTHVDEVVLTWTVVSVPEIEFRMWGRSHADPDGDAWPVECEAMNSPGRYRAVDKPAAAIAEVDYSLEARFGGGEWFVLGELLVETTPISPTQGLRLGTVFPNPFNPQVNIEFYLARDARVLAQVYDVHGRLVRTLADESLGSGAHSLSWDSRNDQGRQQSTGTYLLRLTAGGESQTAKLQLVK